jgi:hypothetical protein
MLVVSACVPPGSQTPDARLEDRAVTGATEPPEPGSRFPLVAGFRTLLVDPLSLPLLTGPSSPKAMVIAVEKYRAGLILSV